MPGINNVRMSSDKLRLLVGGGSADHRASERRPSPPHRVGNVIYPFEVGRPAGKGPNDGTPEGSPEWLRGGWAAFLEKIAVVERLRRDPEEWGPEPGSTHNEGSSATRPAPHRDGSRP
jgi:hypothetical protein